MTDQGIVTRLINEADAHLAARERLYMECARMREEMDAMRASFDSSTRELLNDIDRLTLERDELRREVCELRCNPPERFMGLPHELAKVNGWDCYKEDANAQGQ